MHQQKKLKPVAHNNQAHHLLRPQAQGWLLQQLQWRTPDDWVLPRLAPLLRRGMLIDGARLRVLQRMWDRRLDEQSLV